MKLVAVCVVLAFAGCEKRATGPADAPIAEADARVDARPGSCVASSDCTDPASPVCCLICSPGGACYSMCGVMSVSFCPYSACDPTVTSCTKSDGTLGTCMAFQPGKVGVYYGCM